MANAHHVENKPRYHSGAGSAGETMDLAQGQEETVDEALKQHEAKENK